MIDLRSIGADINKITRTEDGKSVVYEVEKVYPFYVRCKSNTGRVECFNIGDLVVMGIIQTGRVRYSSPYHCYKNSTG